jgi:virulence factor
MERIRVGVIGAGMMGQRHCRVYSAQRRAQLAGVFDVSQDLGRQVARQHEAPFYETVDDLMDQVDAVSIVTPTPAHFDLTMRAIERGIHVLVEKPITETVGQAEALTRAAEAGRAADGGGLVVQVGHIERFNPTYIELKNVLDSLTPLAVSLRRLSPYEGSRTDVDVVLDLMIHDTHLVLDMMGREPAWVSANGLTAFSGAIDHAVAQLSFDAGPLLTMTASRVTEQKVRSIEVTAMEAYLECDLINKSIAVHRRTIGEYVNCNHPGVKYRQESLVERIQVPNSEPLMLELEHFVNCVIERREPLVPARSGLDALRLAAAIREQIGERLNTMALRVRPRVPSSVAQPC